MHTLLLVQLVVRSRTSVVRADSSPHRLNDPAAPALLRRYYVAENREKLYLLQPAILAAARERLTLMVCFSKEKCVIDPRAAKVLALMASLVVSVGTTSWVGVARADDCIVLSSGDRICPQPASERNAGYGSQGGAAAACDQRYLYERVGAFCVNFAPPHYAWIGSAVGEVMFGVYAQGVRVQYNNDYNECPNRDRSTVCVDRYSYDAVISVGTMIWPTDKNFVARDDVPATISIGTASCRSDVTAHVKRESGRGFEKLTRSVVPLAVAGHEYELNSNRPWGPRHVDTRILYEARLDDCSSGSVTLRYFAEAGGWVRRNFDSGDFHAALRALRNIYEKWSPYQ